MSHRFFVGASVLLAAVCARGLASETGTLPVRNGRPVVATVNRDAISLDEFVAQLSPPVARARLQQGRGTTKELELLERLVTIKLLYHEAVTMGIADLPEIRKQVEVSSREILREVLFRRLVKDVRPDPAAIERRFREISREWKTTSVLFQNEAAAKRAKTEIDGGASFAGVAARAVAAKTAKADSDSTYHAQADYLPQIATAIAPLNIGQVSPVIRLQAGYVLVKVLDIRHPPNAQARAEARKNVLNERQLAALKAHDAALKKQYAAVNTTVLKSIDYEAAKPGVEVLLKDGRVVAAIKGAPPITVGDLTDYVRMQFFHGSDQARQRREMNSKKEEALDAMVARRLLNLEAARLGIDKTNEYRDRVNGYKESLVFDAFIQRVIAPGNKMKEEEVRRYYDAHRKEYSNPEMIRARSLAFTGRTAAEAALRKLRDGSDYRWLAANAEGQVDKNAADDLRLDGKPVMIDSMPAAVQKALVGCKSGEFRLYQAAEGPVYLFAIDQVIQPGPKPYQDVREEIAAKLYKEKMTKSVIDYAGKLRAQSRVATYLKKV